MFVTGTLVRERAYPDKLLVVVRASAASVEIVMLGSCVRMTVSGRNWPNVFEALTDEEVDRVVAAARKAGG